MMGHILSCIVFPAVILSYLSRIIFHFGGYIMTSYYRFRDEIPQKGDDILPERNINGKPIFAVDDPSSRFYQYGLQRLNLLLDFINENQLDTLIIFGCAYGRELYPCAHKLLTDGSHIKIIGADLSKKAISTCKTYGLSNADFFVVNMEDRNQITNLFDKLDGRRVGVYMSETAAYMLPHKFKQFVRIAKRYSNITAFQLIEPAYIDWESRYQLGMIFSFQGNFWRHNYPRIIGGGGLL